MAQTLYSVSSEFKGPLKQVDEMLLLLPADLYLTISDVGRLASEWVAAVNNDLKRKQ